MNDLFRAPVYIREAIKELLELEAFRVGTCVCDIGGMHELV